MGAPIQIYLQDEEYIKFRKLDKDTQSSIKKQLKEYMENLVNENSNDIENYNDKKVFE